MSSATYRNFTDNGAHNYQQYFVPAIAIPVSGDLLRAADLHAGERVVDVACGTGVIARFAAERVGPAGSVTGIDIAPEMIDVAKSVAAPAGAAIDWQVSDAASLPLPDESCDVAICQMGLMFMDDRSGALAQMRRVLVPGGRIVVNTPGAIQPPFELMEHAIVENLSPELGGFVRLVFSMNDPELVATLLRDAGFRDVRTTVTTATLKLPGPAEFLWQYINLTPLGPLVAQAPEAAKSAMEQQLVESWSDFVVDGQTLVDQPMVTASARQ